MNEFTVTTEPAEGMCGATHPDCGYMCTRHGHDDGRHRCLTPSFDEEGICTAEWTDTDTGWFNEYVARDNAETAELIRRGSMSDETTAELVIRSVELSVQVDDEVQKYRANPYPDDQKMIAWAMHFINEVHSDRVAELLAVAIGKLAEEGGGDD